MMKGFKGVLGFAVAIAAAYLFLAMGEYVSSGIAPTTFSTNAFLFLMGLGGFITLLSPSPSRLRHRW